MEKPKARPSEKSKAVALQKEHSLDHWICQANTEKKISQLDDQRESIRIILRYMVVILGIKKENYPQDEDKEILIDHLGTHIAHYSQKEYKIALTLFVQKKLDFHIYLSEISVLFVEQLMQSYARYRFSYLRDPTYKQLPERTPLTPQQRDANDKEHCLQAFNHYKATKQLLDFGSVKYNYLKKSGLINHTPELWQQFITQAKNPPPPSKAPQKIASALLAMHRLSPEAIRADASTLALKYYFDSLIRKGKQLEDLLKTPEPCQ